jgi:hypothetical protein
MLAEIFTVRLRRFYPAGLIEQKSREADIKGLVKAAPEKRSSASMPAHKRSDRRTGRVVPDDVWDLPPSFR